MVDPPACFPRGVADDRGHVTYLRLLVHFTDRLACPGYTRGEAELPNPAAQRAVGRNTDRAAGWPGTLRLAGQASSACRARRVRSARRRQPVLSRTRSRGVRTVLTLMYSSAAI